MIPCSRRESTGLFYLGSSNMEELKQGAVSCVNMMLDEGSGFSPELEDIG